MLGSGRSDSVPPVSVEIDVAVRPPHTIISVPDHIPVCKVLPVGASVRGVAVHVSVDGSYLAPVDVLPEASNPAHTTISIPVHIAI